MSRIAVIDFETTGMSPAEGDRPTEVAIVMTEHGRVVDQYQRLMNPGRYIPGFISQLTGITNAMVRTAPAVSHVMAEAARFVGDVPLVAHNASFDRKFWQAELAHLGLGHAQPFACTVLLARRLYPRHPITSSAPWPTTCACRARGGPTGRCRMRKSPRPCWAASRPI